MTAKITSPLNRRSKRYADGYEYPWHWSTARIRRYKKFIKLNPEPKGERYFAWYSKLANWMEAAGFDSSPKKEGR